MRYSLVLAVALVACQPPETSPRSGARSLTEYTPEVSPGLRQLEPLIDSFELGCTPTTLSTPSTPPLGPEAPG